MPLVITYHRHKVMFIDKPKSSAELILRFHKDLERHRTAIEERYGWRPTIEQRVDIDANACLIAFALNADNRVMAQIASFDVSDSPHSKCSREKEISLLVLPSHQRKHLATDLVHLAWDLFADPADECWIYVLNSRKSGMFWRRFKQWYPDVAFRLVKP